MRERSGRSGRRRGSQKPGTMTEPAPSPRAGEGVLAVEASRTARENMAANLFTDSPLLHPELIHPHKGFWILGLEHMPVREIGHRLVVGKSFPVAAQHRRVELE